MAVFHHDHTLCKPAHHVEVVGDQQNRHAVGLLQLQDEVEDLRPHRDIQRGGGFVGQQQFGLARQGHGNHGALPLAAAKLVWV